MLDDLLFRTKSLFPAFLVSASAKKSNHHFGFSDDSPKLIAEILTVFSEKILYNPEMTKKAKREFFRLKQILVQVCSLLF